ncbi:MAG: bifunctional hydroxymethylpyrimidine kinase/phosphomethylpyrimidine kinase [Acidimicrobiales bacterium]
MALSRPVALTVAGSDSGGGAGVVADLKVFEALGVWGAVAVTAVTAQNSVGVGAIHLVPPDVVRAQIEAVAGDLGVGAAKTGMLGSSEGVRAVADALRGAGIAKVVVDPVLWASHGAALLAGGGVEALVEDLLPLATVLTPNLAEASALLGRAIRDRDVMVIAAEALRGLGPEVVMIKGGHLDDSAGAPDLLFGPDGAEWLEAPRVATTHTHGTGCVLSAAIAAYLARGAGPLEACRAAKAFVSAAIRAGGPRGAGVGPVDPGSGPR